jgi:hypothetical protein
MKYIEKMNILVAILKDINIINNIIVDATVNDDDEEFEGYDLFIASRSLRDLLSDLSNEIDIDLIRKINSEIFTVCEYSHTRIPHEDAMNLENLCEKAVKLEDELYCF